MSFLYFFLQVLYIHTGLELRCLVLALRAKDECNSVVWSGIQEALGSILSTKCHISLCF